MNARRLAAAPLLVASVLACAAREVVAQELRGTVRDSATHQPLAGATVTLVDTAGAPVGREITDSRGDYRVLLDPRARELRVVRIGFRPRALGIPRSLPERLDVAMTRLPTMLEPIRVLGDTPCPRRDDGPRALGLWEQARAGLLTTVVARRIAPLAMKRLQFQRDFDGTSQRVTRMQVAIDSSRTTSIPFFAARTSTDFVRSGFARDSAGLRTLFGPDADILLDESFARAYCFHLLDADKSRPMQVGLGFSAARHQRAVIEIDGSLWIDTAARRLVEIDYKYRGLGSAIEAAGPGGTISFRELENGVVLIDRWSIRAVTFAAETTYRATSEPAIRRWLEARETGGALARAVWSDGARIEGRLGTLRLDIRTRDRKPASAAIVSLTGTGYRATVDAAGVAEIRDLVPGPYSASIVDPALEPLGLVIPTSFTFEAQRDSVVRATLEMPTAEDVVADACLESGKGLEQPLSGTGWVLGRVIGAREDAIRGMHWSISVANGPSDWLELATGRLSGTGVFQYCKLERGADIQIAVWGNGTARRVMTRRIETKINIVPFDIR